jgi:FtsZ-binding cell division protein ZapB
MVLKKMDDLELDIKKILEEIVLLRKTVDEMAVLIEKTKSDLEKANEEILLNSEKLEGLESENDKLNNSQKKAIERVEKVLSSLCVD